MNIVLFIIKTEKLRFENSLNLGITFFSPIFSKTKYIAVVSQKKKKNTLPSTHANRVGNSSNNANIL